MAIAFVISVQGAYGHTLMRLEALEDVCHVCAGMKIGVIGSCNGELDRVYEAVRKLAKQGIVLELLIACGDFMALRDQSLETTFSDLFSRIFQGTQRENAWKIT